MPEKNESRRVLEEAIRFETDGREFFLKAAEKARNYFAKVIFQILAEEELDHIRKVKKIHEGTLTSAKQEIPLSAPKQSNLQNVFQQAKAQMGQNVTVDADEMEAIRLAIQLEIKGHEFYKRLAEEATNDFEKAFYQHLAQEESVHFSVLRQMEEAVMNPASFG